MRLELGCGAAPTPGYVHHDRRKHAPHVDVAHDLDVLPWPWPDTSCGEILALDVFEHLHRMPAEWLQECHRLLRQGGVFRLRVPVFGGPWHRGPAQDATAPPTTLRVQLTTRHLPTPRDRP